MGNAENISMEQSAEDRGQRTDDRDQMTEDKRQIAEVGLGRLDSFITDK